MAADTWGLSWGGTGGSWLASWASLYVPPDPPPPPPVETAAGKKKHKRKFYVEIDNQRFDVDSPAEAIQILNHARALAERAAELAVKKVEVKAKQSPKPKPIRVLAPKITASPELQIDLAPIRQDLKRIYSDAAVLAELRLLMQRAEEDEEETILLLM